MRRLEDAVKNVTITAPAGWRVSFRPYVYAALLLVAGAGCDAAPAPIGYTMQVAPNHKPTLLDRGPPGLDRKGNACVRDGRRITLLPVNGRPEERDFAATAAAAIDRDLFPGKSWDRRFDTSLLVDDGIVFDAAGRAYTLVIPRYSNLKTAALLWSTDGCRSWRAIALSAVNATMEKPDAFNDHAGPPTILSFENYGAVTGAHLWLERFAGAEGGVRRLGEALPVADDSLLVANHSGGGNSTMTMADRIMVVYPTTDKSAPGTQSVARQLNRATGTWTGPAREIGRSTTKVTPDAHDIPAIAQLPSGKLLVVIGAHQAQFRLFESAAPRDISKGWVAGTTIGTPGGDKRFAKYSYIALNVAQDGTLNIIARAEGTGSYDLVQLRKAPGGSWTSWPGGALHRVIASPKRLSYAAWRQQVVHAPDGTLYLHFGYFPNMLLDAEAGALGLAKAKDKGCTGERCWYPTAPVLKPVTLRSNDNGLTWR
jgi:hypothetical protein